VAAELGHALNGDWTLLRGYRSRRGEIDELLMGPTGLLEQRLITDRTGRSPSEQLNEPAD
jgi:hypothetical protein